MAGRTYSFTKGMRVRHRLEFSAVFEGKVREARGPLVVYAIPTDHQTPRLGLSVPKHVGTAPRRNRIKRLIREAFRLMQHDFPRSYDCVVVVRPHEPFILAEYQKLLSALVMKLHRRYAARDEASR